jgi:hypothetical protein
LRRTGKAGWNSETGITCPTFFTTLPDVDGLRRRITRSSWPATFAG